MFQICKTVQMEKFILVFSKDKQIWVNNYLLDVNMMLI